jgi:hypothetical protein
LAQAELFGLAGDADDRYTGGVPPWPIGVFFGCGDYFDRAPGDLAGIAGAAEFASLVGEGVAVVFVEGASAVVTGVDFYF